MAEKPVICPSCGYKNQPATKRCVSCGGKTALLGTLERSKQEALARRYQQDAFSVVWLMVAIVVQGVLTGAVLFGLPQLVTTLDFEGSHGMVASIGVWFVGGMLVGLVSPGRTFLEPFIGTFIIGIPTILYLYRSETVFTLPPFLYVVLGAVGILFALIGSYLGERIQMGPPPKAAD